MINRKLIESIDALIFESRPEDIPRLTCAKISAQSSYIEQLEQEYARIIQRAEFEAFNAFLERQGK